MRIFSKFAVISYIGGACLTTLSLNVVNPSFEMKQPAHNKIPGWQIKNASPNCIQIDEDNSSSGKRSLKLVQKKNADGSVKNSYIYQKITGTFPSNKLYTFSMKAKGEKLIPLKSGKGWHAYGQLEMRDSKYKIIRRIFLTIPDGDTPWKEYKTDFSIPEEVKILRIVIGFYNTSGIFNVDDIELKAGAFKDNKNPETDKNVILFHYHNGMALREMASAGINAVTHVPYRPEFVAAANRLGIKIMPYVSALKVSKSDSGPAVLRHPFWKEVDASRHPDWFAYDKNGKIVLYTANYYEYIKVACHYQEALRQAFEKGIKNLLKLGCRGVFVDNVSEYRYNSLPCCGQKLGLHKHANDSIDQIEYYKDSLKRIRDTVKKADPGNIVFINASRYPTWAEFGDITMHEHFVEATPAPDKTYDRRQMVGRKFSWSNFWRMYNQTCKTQKKIAVAASTLTFVAEAPEHLFYSFCLAKLLGCRHWCGNSRSEGSWRGIRFNSGRFIRMLYRIYNPGKAISPPLIASNYGYEQYEKASFVLNPQNKTQSVRVPVNQLKQPVAELFTGRQIPVDNGKANIEMPYYSGRVLMSRNDVLSNYARELSGQLDTLVAFLEFTGGNRLETLRELREKAFQIREKAKASSLAENAADAITCRLAGLKPADFLTPIGETLVKEGAKLDREAVKQLFKGSAKELLKAEIFESGSRKTIVLRSKGACYIMRPAFEFGLDSFYNLEAGAVQNLCCSADCNKLAFFPSLQNFSLKVNTGKDNTWLIPCQYKKLEILEDSKKCKKLRFVCSLKNKKGEKINKDLLLQITIDVNKDSQFMGFAAHCLDASMRPAKKEIQLFLGSFSRAVKHPAAKGKTGYDWLFFPKYADDFNGVAAISRKQPLKTNSGWICSNSDGLLDLAFAPVSLMDYYFLEQRLRNARIAAGRMAQLLHNIYLDLEAPEYAVADKKLQIKLALTNHGGIPAKVEYSLASDVSSVKYSLLTRPLKIKESAPGNFIIEKVCGEQNDLLMLDAAAKIKLPSGDVFYAEDMALLRLTDSFTYSVNQLPQDSPSVAKVAVKIKSAGLTLNGSIAFKAPGTDSKKSFSLSAGSREQDFEFAISIPGKSNLLVPAEIELKTDNLKISKKYRIKISPIVEAPLFLNKPVIDGKLNEKCWEKAGTAENFVDVMNSKKSLYQTRIFVGYDRNALYIAFKCYRKGLQIAKARKDNSFDNFALRRDSVEVYLQPDPANMKYGRLGLNYLGQRKSENYTDFKAETTVSDGYWIAELAIPFSTIGHGPEGTWGINFCKNSFPDKHSPEFSCWSNTFGSYGNPGRFGWLKFKN